MSYHLILLWVILVKQYQYTLSNPSNKSKIYLLDYQVEHMSFLMKSDEEQERSESNGQVIQQFFEQMSRSIQITIVPREAGEVIDFILDDIISQVVAPPVDTQDKPLKELIPHIYNENYKVHQGRCFQQNSPNLCGYHAVFNTLCFLQMFKGGKADYDLQSGASFWRFKTKVENFLFMIKRKYHKPDEWPWREKDILYGDFERTYNQICMQKFNEFSIFRKHEHFYYLSNTWEFQYQNLLGSLESKTQIHERFQQFRNYQGEKPLILHLMLAITTHWLTFFAVKQGGQVQYWFFDSNNNYYLDFDWQQITDFIEMKNQERIQLKKTPFTNFQKESYSMFMRDVQISLKLIIGSIEGTDNLEAYSYNRQFHIFAEPLEAAMCVGHQEVSVVVREYQHDINRFFQKKVEWKLFYQDNHLRMKKIIEFSAKMKNNSQETRYLHSLVDSGTRISYWTRSIPKF